MPNKNKKLALAMLVATPLILVLSSIVFLGLKKEDKQQTVKSIDKYSLGLNKVKKIDLNPNKDLDAVKLSTEGKLVLNFDGKDNVLEDKVATGIDPRVLSNGSIFYISDNDSQLQAKIYSPKTNKTTAYPDLLAAYPMENADIYKFRRSDGLAQLNIANATDPFLIGTDPVVYSLKDNTVAIIDYHPELDTAMPGFFDYDKQSGTFNLRLQKVNIENGKRYGDITLQNAEERRGRLR